jgi:hypothetical protein
MLSLGLVADRARRVQCFWRGGPVGLEGCGIRIVLDGKESVVGKLVLD